MHFNFQGYQGTIKGVGFGVSGSGFRVQGLGFRVLGVRASLGIRFRVQGLGMVVPIYPIIVVSTFFSMPSFPANHRPEKASFIHIPRSFDALHILGLQP